MGVSDYNSTFYVNFQDNRVPSKLESRVKELKSMLNYTHQWLDIWAGKNTDDQIKAGHLSGGSDIESQTLRNNYRHKVIDVLVGKAAWMMESNTEDKSFGIEIKKENFHFEILKAMLSGLAQPQSLLQDIEDALQSIADTINESKSVEQSQSMYSLNHVIFYDSAADDVTASFRTVWYSIDESMKTVVSNKSSTQEVNVTFEFASRDFTFNEETWRSQKDAVVKFVEDAAAADVNDPLDGGEILPDA
ncbi:uncharacterized protein BO80DRAFT_367892 [Aspergillus ibericus CBS 121593]|uniref:Uncharacterized protein n=1 Tax=Aspergillus ibericus CBS 121593 TaxID=1448316 RepID=A0A395GKL5_9EURO|nr:hypothetical protein BO80DRAFT_367892 [Aspergillus ibericus CBS 121593]RAK95852.1 hypothetical protein BO80DRAFT_367892 [Aspergillus ibericus CBS 121593]